MKKEEEVEIPRHKWVYIVEASVPLKNGISRHQGVTPDGMVFRYRCSVCFAVVVVHRKKDSNPPNSRFLRNHMKGKINCLQGQVSRIMEM